jgi:two-component system alkaline phosphatase synthesis response regulator PhoP
MTKANIVLAINSEIEQHINELLVSEGFKNVTTLDKKDILNTNLNPHLILLGDDFELCKSIRKISKFDDTLIVFINEKIEDYIQILALECGADDYIPTSFKDTFLLAKIKAILRRSNKVVKYNELHLNGIILDKHRYSFIKDNKETRLPKIEFKILELLMSKPNSILDRNVISEKVWGDEFVSDTTINVHIRKIREKIGSDNIRTIKRVGYKFESK